MTMPETQLTDPAAADVPAADPGASTAPVDTAPADQAPSKPAVPSVGEAVRFTYFDYRAGAGGADVTKFGVVMDVLDEHPDGTKRLDANGEATPAVVVAWFPDVSDPVPVSELEW